MTKIKNIIFIHGWASGPYVWLHQLEHFRNKYNVYAPELIGYGKKMVSVPILFEDTAQDLINFISKNKLTDICLVGWSFGGMLSLKIAAGLKDKIRRLVLIDTTPRFVQSGDFGCAVSKEVIEKIYNRIQGDFEGTLRWFYRFCFSPNERSRNEFNEALKLAGDFITPLNEQTLLDGLKVLMKLDIRRILKDITMPALIIHGRQDKICPPQAGEFLKKKLKNARIFLIDGAGHAPFLTQPQTVNALIEDFISE